MTSDLTPLDEGEPGALVESDRPLFDWGGDVMYICKRESSRSARRRRKETERNRTRVGLQKELTARGAYIVAY